MAGSLHVLLLQLAPPLPSSLASIKLANPGSPGKMAVKTERDREGCSFLWLQKIKHYNIFLRLGGIIII